MRVARLAMRSLSVAWAMVVVGGFVALLAIRAAGWRVESIATPSMSPAIPQGSAALVAPIDADDLSRIRPGEVILFAHPDADRLVMHRVVEVLEQDGTTFFRTQGDANDGPDLRLVPESDVDSLVRGSVPRVGDLLEGLAPPLGLVWLVALPWAVFSLPDLIIRRVGPHSPRPVSDHIMEGEPA